MSSIPRKAASFGRRHALMLGAALAAGLTGCRDKLKEAEDKAEPAVDALIPLVERDTKQLRDGLPKGAAILAQQLDSEPGDDREGLRRALAKARAGVPELAVAKGTFFVFVSPGGIVLRGESDPDLAADKSLIEAVDGAKAILAKDAGLTETWGYMEGLRGVNTGGDLQWIVGHPVVAGGELKGAFVSDWSLRAYAKVLELALQAHLLKVQEDPNKPTPLFYAFVLKGDQAFGAPVTPDENMKALGELGIAGQVAGGGVFKRTLEVDGRRFVVAAKAAPALGPDVAVAVMLSPV
jgi:hypothetical protein